MNMRKHICSEHRITPRFTYRTCLPAALCLLGASGSKAIRGLAACLGAYPATGFRQDPVPNIEVPKARWKNRKENGPTNFVKASPPRFQYRLKKTQSHAASARTPFASLFLLHPSVSCAEYLTYRRCRVR